MSAISSSTPSTNTTLEKRVEFLENALQQLTLKVEQALKSNKFEEFCIYNCSYCKKEIPLNVDLSIVTSIGSYFDRLRQEFVVNCPSCKGESQEKVTRLRHDEKLTEEEAKKALKAQLFHNGTLKNKEPETKVNG